MNSPPRWLLIGLVSTLLGCAPPTDRDRPNILLITLDTTRADRLSMYGAPAEATPRLAAIARQGVIFDLAYCDVTHTKPSLASTLTGTFAYRHGVRILHSRLPASVTTVTELLKQVGFATGAVVGSFPLNAKFQFDQGFDVYDDGFSHFFRSDADVTQRASRLMAAFAEEDEPFFLWAHYFGPHRQVRTEENEQHVERYSSKLAQTDVAVANLVDGLESLGIVKTTLVIIHADHGESLGEHSYIGHGRYLYEPTLRVPLVMRWPAEIPPGRRVSSLVGNIDIAPTILDAAGFESVRLEAMDGRSLLPLIDSGRPVRDSLYIETYLPVHSSHAEVQHGPEGPIRVGVRRTGMIQPPWKYVETHPHRLYDEPDAVVPDALADRIETAQLFHLGRDREELHPLGDLPEEIEQIDRLRTLLYARRSDSERAEEAEGGELSERDLDQLRGLGYVE